MTASTRELDDHFEKDLCAVLLGRVPSEIPARLIDHVTAIHGDSGGHSVLGWLKRGMAAAATAAAVFMIVVLAWTSAFGAKRLDPASIGSGHAAHSWGTQLATLEADDLVVDVGGLSFRPSGSVGTHSDAGTASYRTLEMSWHQGDLEMRLYLYFGADKANWWVSSMRSYDGTAPGDWIYYVTPQVKAPLGQTWTGDVDVLGLGLHGVGRVHIDGLRLTTFSAGTIPHLQDGCRLVGPAPAVPGQQVDSPSGPAISAAALSPGMSAQKAAEALDVAGVCYEFRLEYSASNAGQTWCSAPPGEIREWLFGSDGRVILFVEASPTQTLPPGAPQVVGC